MTAKITKIGSTNDMISRHEGHIFILCYIEKTALYIFISSVILKKINANSKGLQLQRFIYPGKKKREKREGEKMKNENRTVGSEGSESQIK